MSRLADIPTNKLLAYREALVRQVKQQRLSKITYYQPHAAQDVFHCSLARTRGLMGGNRSGKSTANIMEAAAHLIGYRPWLPQDHPHYRVRNAEGDPIRLPSVGTIVVQSYKAVERILMPKFREWLPHGFIVRETMGQNRAVDQFECANGSKVRFMTHNQKPREFEGHDNDWASYDEPPPRDLWVANERSLVDRAGRSWMTATAIEQPWVTDDLIFKADGNDDIDIFYMDSYDNKWVSPVELDRFFDKIADDAERHARKTGEPLHLSGRVFKQFQARPPWYIEWFPPKRKWVRVMGIDPHPVKPVACIWYAISIETNIWYAYRELYDPGLKTIPDVVERIKEVEKADPKISFRIIDPSSQERSRTSKGYTSVYEQFMDNGIFCEMAQKADKDARIRLLQQRFVVSSITQTPTLVVMNSCPHFKGELLSHIWDSWKLRSARDEKDDKGTVVKRADDMIDATEYLLQYGEKTHYFKPELLDDEDYEDYDSTGMSGIIRQTGAMGAGGY